MLYVIIIFVYGPDYTIKYLNLNVPQNSGRSCAPSPILICRSLYSLKMIHRRMCAPLYPLFIRELIRRCVPLIIDGSVPPYSRTCASKFWNTMCLLQITFLGFIGGHIGVFVPLTQSSVED